MARKQQTVSANEAKLRSLLSELADSVEIALDGAVFTPLDIQGQGSEPTAVRFSWKRGLQLERGPGVFAKLEELEAHELVLLAHNARSIVDHALMCCEGTKLAVVAAIQGVQEVLDDLNAPGVAFDAGEELQP